MQPRGTRLACSLRTVDGCNGSFSVYPGETPRSIARVDPVSWDRVPEKDTREGAFTIIGEMGMTGSIILLNQSQWHALTKAKLEEPFYAAILWGGNPLKVVDDATLLVKRGA